MSPNPLAEPYVLERFFYGKDVTLGLLWVDNFVVYTAEDGWKQNLQNVSCIPDGLYHVVPRRFYGGGYDAWEITNVPNRSTILIHRGNTANDVRGCVVVGVELGAFGGGLGVANSAAAWRVLFGALGGKSFALRIKPYGPLKGTTPLGG